jgi:LuxR family transcriptional regulator of csgAB operon
MMVETLEDKGCRAQLSDNVIYVVGPSSLQNSLMATFLRQATGAKCLVTEGLLKVPRKDDEDIRDKSLILWDWLGRDAKDCSFEFDIDEDKIFRYRLVALFNLSRGIGIEEKVVAHWVEGFFYEHDSMENLVKGVRAILGGELWISRTILADYMRKNSRRNQTNKPRKRDADLTPREIEILLMIASGAKNAQIAGNLFISPHTVRTHVYNIYRKIGVENRFEAILWSTQNM